METNFHVIDSFVIENAFTGEKVQIQELWQDKPVLICFFRRFLCKLCRYSALRLSKLQSYLDSMGIKLIAVGFENIGLQEFVNGEYFTGEIYLDLERHCYKALKFKRPNFMSGTAMLMFDKRVARELKNSRNVQIGGFKGDGMQMGGTFVVDKGGRVILSHKQQWFGHMPASHELLAACLQCTTKSSAPVRKLTKVVEQMKTENSDVRDAQENDTKTETSHLAKILHENEEIQKRRSSVESSPFGTDDSDAHSNSTGDVDSAALRTPSSSRSSTPEPERKSVPRFSSTNPFAHAVIGMGSTNVQSPEEKVPNWLADQRKIAKNPHPYGHFEPSNPFSTSVDGDAVEPANFASRISAQPQETEFRFAVDQFGRRVPIGRPAPRAREEYNFFDLTDGEDEYESYDDFTSLNQNLARVPDDSQSILSGDTFVDSEAFGSEMDFYADDCVSCMSDSSFRVRSDSDAVVQTPLRPTHAHYAYQTPQQMNQRSISSSNPLLLG